MNKEKIKAYDLNLKTIFLIIVIFGTVSCYSAYVLFFAPAEERERILHDSVLYFMSDTPVIFVFFSGTLCIPYVIYLIALVTYKRKNVLIIHEDKIEYYILFKKKMVIEKEDISDIYVSEKLVIKYNEKNKLKMMKINLVYFKCDKNEIRKLIIALKPENDIIKNIYSNILKKYNLTDLTQLKENKEALEDCIFQLYNINKLTQQEIASLLNTNTTKVSKIISKFS